MIRRIQIFVLIYLLTCVVYLVFSKSTPIWNAIYYIKEHVFIILLLFFVKQYLYSYIDVLLIWGVIVYKFELILFNICISITDKASFDFLCKLHDIAMILTGSIWLIITICLIVKKWR